MLIDITEKLLTEGGKLLVIQTAFLGDVILLTPLLRAIRATFPKVKITAVTIPECSILLNELVDEVVTFDKLRQEDRQRRWTELIECLSAKNFSCALIPHRSISSANLARKAGIKLRVGFDRGWASLVHSVRVPYRYNLYEGLRNIDLLKKITDVRNSNGLPELHPRDDDIAVVEEKMREMEIEKDKFIVIAPGSVWRSKRWAPEYYRRVISLILQETGLPSVALGGNADTGVCSGVVAEEKYNLAGVLNPLQSAVLTSNAKMMISGDSAPAHIATAMRTRQVIIFGSTAPRFGFFPPTDRARALGADLWCRPCTDHGRQFCPRLGTFKCVSDVTPESVIETATDWLES